MIEIILNILETLEDPYLEKLLMQLIHSINNSKSDNTGLYLQGSMHMLASIIYLYNATNVNETVQSLLELPGFLRDVSMQDIHPSLSTRDYLSTNNIPRANTLINDAYFKDMKDYANAVANFAPHNTMAFPSFSEDFRNNGAAGEVVRDLVNFANRQLVLTHNDNNSFMVVYFLVTTHPNITIDPHDIVIIFRTAGVSDIDAIAPFDLVTVMGIFNLIILSTDVIHPERETGFSYMVENIQSSMDHLRVRYQIYWLQLDIEEDDRRLVMYDSSPFGWTPEVNRLFDRRSDLMLARIRTINILRELIIIMTSPWLG